ncbi:peptide ABC transporter substrate-binding protein [Clostridium celatum]|uniref:peptide ABC transporter substrate-binding protein n=1 Tax=Clostridium celatum TaxID=36834 RepID=UPI001897B54C|nr:peptide ABC transporter substrate-binding protein [Clostridium celatum]
MKTGKIKKLCALALALALGVTSLVGCGSNETGDSSTETENNQTSSTTETTESEQELVYNLGAETKTIDPALNNAVDGSIIIANAFEGLMKLDENQKAIPGIAESYDVSEDNLVYTFHLRSDAKWSDGEQVKAGDFEYAWKRVLNPDTAADYAFQLYYLVGAEEYNTGSGSVDEVGVKALDDETLEVTLKNPTTYFLELTAFPTLMPVREDIVSANPDAWTQEPELYVSNGPFTLKEYNMKDSYVFVKNENYYGKDNVKLDTLKFRMIEDEVSAYASVKNGEVDMSENLPTAEIQPGQEEGYVEIYPYLGTYFYAINVNNNTDKLPEDVQKALSDKRVRQALSLAIDRTTIVENVTMGGQIPAYSYVPEGIPGGEEGTEFADKKYWDVDDMDGNIEKAKALLEEAGYPNGEGLPTFELLYNTNEGNKLIAESIQQMWAAIGVNVELANQEWAVFQDSRKNGNFQIARHGWIGDYVDPMTFLDMWMTGLGNNDPKFSNEEYDSLITQAMAETDSVKRSEILRQAEDILMDEMPIIPIYYYTQVKAVNLKVKGVVVSPLGQVYFENAYIEE